MNRSKIFASVNKIEFYQLHPEYTSFIGADFDTYRILQIGESHYINQLYVPDTVDKYSLKYFCDNWWTSSCPDVTADYGLSFNTRDVIEKYMQGNPADSVGIFNNVVKAFSKVVLGREISSISTNDKQLYRYFAFMNFYQMPAIYNAMNIWESMCKSSIKTGSIDDAYMAWNTLEAESVSVVDKVIEVLNPMCIVFTSVSATEAYKHGNGRYVEDSRVIYTSHPGYPYTWWKSVDRYNGKRAVDMFEEGLRKIYLT